MAKLYSSITFGADAWVNTGIIPNLNTRAELYNVSLANNIYYYCIMGSENSDGRPYCFRIRTSHSTDSFEFYFGDGGTSLLNGLLPLVNADIIADKNTFQVDNNSYSFNTTTIINNYPVYLGADNRGGNAVDAKGGLTIGEFKLYKDGVLVCDLFPATDDNNVPCLYDSVSETYKYNGGSGTLTLGEPLNVFSISTDSETVSVDGSSFSVDITSENPWTASTTDSWVTLSNTTGLTDATITVTVSDNYNKPQRVGTVTFTDGEDTLTLTITQNADTRLLLKNIYRNGNSVKMMFRNGQKIYQQLIKSNIVPENGANLTISTIFIVKN